jgi:hypothetical protein
VAAKTHIDDALVAAAPSFAQLVPQVQERLAGTVLLAHNAPFDVGFLRTELQRLLPPGASLALPPVLDTCLLARQIVHCPSYRLEDLAATLGLPSTDPGHRALPDCLTTWALLEGLIARLRQRGRILRTLADLLRVLPHWSARPPQPLQPSPGSPARTEEGPPGPLPGPERDGISAIPQRPSAPVLVDAWQHTLPPATRAALAALNTSGDPPASLLGALALPGPDAFDGFPLDVLRLRTGPRAAAQVAAAGPGVTQQAGALRWALRGLAVPLAIRKALLDSPPPALPPTFGAPNRRGDRRPPRHLPSARMNRSFSTVWCPPPPS